MQEGGAPGHAGRPDARGVQQRPLHLHAHLLPRVRALLPRERPAPGRGARRDPAHPHQPRQCARAAAGGPSALRLAMAARGREGLHAARLPETRATRYRGARRGAAALALDGRQEGSGARPAPAVRQREMHPRPDARQLPRLRDARRPQRQDRRQPGRDARGLPAAGLRVLQGEVLVQRQPQGCPHARPARRRVGHARATQGGALPRPVQGATGARP
mmetsp:Transcript_79008/g.191067  ORF Transcript_79008/g.191067 Transcript_79008/m.191067 type:complete len:217 (-) Transcript_79008:742-1392(-)